MSQLKKRLIVMKIYFMEKNLPVITQLRKTTRNRKQEKNTYDKESRPS